MIVAVEPVVVRRRLHRVEWIDAERGHMRSGGLRGDRQGDGAGRFAALDPGDELRHELYGRRGVAVDGLPAGAVVETGNHIEPAERLRGGLPSCLSHDRAIV